MIKQMCLSIIIVNYRNYELTIKCIKSVKASIKNINYEIIVIDNDSPNQSYEKILNEFNNDNVVSVIKNNKNSGFGAANNLGAEKAGGEYVLFLNPDIVVVGNAIEKMLNKIKEDSEIGLLSGKLLNDDRSVQYSCRRILPLNKFLCCRTPISKLVSKNKKEQYDFEYLMKDFNHDVSSEVEWVMGACVLMRKEFFFEVGKFSKEYFMYFEDVDLCYKVRKKGKKVYYLADAELIHLHRQESTKKLSKMTMIHLKSMSKFYYKYYFNKFDFK